MLVKGGNSVKSFTHRGAWFNRRDMMFAGILRIMFLILMILPLDSFAAGSPESKQSQRPKIGVVF